MTSRRGSSLDVGARGSGPLSKMRVAALLGAMLLASCSRPATSVAVTPRDALDHSYAMLADELASSCAGRLLLSELDAAWRNLGRDVTLPMLVQELKRHVQSRTGMVVDASDTRLHDSALALREAPTGEVCTSLVAVMGLIDEWSARATGTSLRREPSERFLQKINDPARRRKKGQSVDAWLAAWFPPLHADARESLDYLVGTHRAGE